SLASMAGLAPWRPPSPLVSGLRVARVGFGGLVLGALATANAWDFPTYAALALGAAGLGGGVAGARVGGRGTRAAEGLGAVGLAFGLYWPFWVRYRSFYQGVEAIPYRTALPEYLAINGLFLFVIGSALLALAWRLIADGRNARLIGLLVGRFDR